MSANLGHTPQFINSVFALFPKQMKIQEIVCYWTKLCLNIQESPPEPTKLTKDRNYESKKPGDHKNNKHESANKLRPRMIYCRNSSFNIYYIFNIDFLCNQITQNYITNKCSILLTLKFAQVIRRNKTDDSYCQSYRK